MTPQIFFHGRRIDPILIGSAFLLSAMGLLSLYSSSLGAGNFLNFQKQIGFFIAGVIIMAGLSFFDWRALRADPYFILFLYLLCLIALAGLFIFAPEIRGTRSWYKIGSFSADPIEPTKIVILLLLAKYFSQRHVELYNVRHMIFSGIYVAIPAFLIFLHPDLGSVIILGAVWLGILLISGIKLRHFILLCVFFAVLSAAGWSFALKDYQKARIVSFLNPGENYLSAGWQQAQSKIAIGSGGLFGKGLGRGAQTQYGFLPEPQTDFIFAAIAEEMGAAGTIFLFGLFFALLWRILKIAFDASNNFTRLFAAGFAVLILSQIFINIGMNLGFLPIIGIPLPFVSYGGSGLIMAYAGIGILQSMKIH